MNPFTKIVSRKLRDEVKDVAGSRRTEAGLSRGLPLLRREIGSALGQLHVPPVDVYRKDGKILVLMDVPGYSREDLEVVVPETTETDVLRVRGQRSTVEEEPGEVLEPVYGERAGSFDRRVALPETCLTEDVAAGLDGGVLRVEMRRVAGTPGVNVEIR